MKRKRKGKAPARAPSEYLVYEFDFEPPEDVDEDDSDNEEPPASRRRVSRPATWKRNQRKPRAVSEKAPCGCKLRCYARLGRAKRKKIRASFQGLDRPQQKAYMRGLIDLHAVKRRKGAALQVNRRRKPRSFTAEYHLKTTTNSHKRHRVCLKAFTAILGIGTKQVKNLNAYAWANPNKALVPVDMRGKHDTRPNRIPADVVAQIDDHIKSFPRESSHYSLKTSKTFLSSDLSARKMWHLYLEKYEPHIRIIPSSDSSGADSDDTDSADGKEEKKRQRVGGGGGGGGGGGEDIDDDDAAQKPQITYDYYNERFNNFDLAFGKPVVDSCSTCDELELKIAAAEDEDDAAGLRAEWREHKLDAERGYAMRCFFCVYACACVCVYVYVYVCV
jgi:hypothetical protein